MRLLLQHLECVDSLFSRMATELFAFMTSVAKQSDKHADKVRLANFGYFVHSVQPRRVAVLEAFVASAAAQRDDALGKYQNWMVTYEFPSLASLALRLDGIGKRINDEELSLYIRRKDIKNVIKEMDLKSLEQKVGTLRKRLEKHLASDFDAVSELVAWCGTSVHHSSSITVRRSQPTHLTSQELRLVPQLWTSMKDRVVGILERLEKAAALSYQITFDVGPAHLRALFDKYSDSVGRSTVTAASNDADSEKLPP